ncbi:MAG: hypothetical protein ABIO02_00665 [Patescibacteria group bacterium]
MGDISQEFSTSPLEQPINNGLGLQVEQKTLYHGTGISGIQQFNKAEEYTVGTGVYFTSDEHSAEGYARRRAKRVEGAQPLIYEASVESVKLADFRNDDSTTNLLTGFIPYLEKIKKSLESSKDINEFTKIRYLYTIIPEAINKIQSGTVNAGRLKEVTDHLSRQFSEYLESIGYDGLITAEGGEGDEVGQHETWLIFDPQKVSIKEERKVT